MNLVDFFITVPTDSSRKQSRFYCVKGVLVLTDGASDVSEHLQGAHHFPRDQRLRLETPGWNFIYRKVARAADGQNQEGFPVLPNREYPLHEDLFPVEAEVVNPNCLWWQSCCSWWMCSGWLEATSCWRSSGPSLCSPLRDWTLYSLGHTKKLM